MGASESEWEDEHEEVDAAAEIWRGIRRRSSGRESPVKTENKRRAHGLKRETGQNVSNIGTYEEEPVVSAPWL